MQKILTRAAGQGTEYEEMIDAQNVATNFYWVGGLVAVEQPSAECCSIMCR